MKIKKYLNHNLIVPSGVYILAIILIPESSPTKLLTSFTSWAVLTFEMHIPSISLSTHKLISVMSLAVTLSIYEKKVNDYLSEFNKNMIKMLISCMNYLLLQTNLHLLEFILQFVPYLQPSLIFLIFSFNLYDKWRLAYKILLSSRCQLRKRSLRISCVSHAFLSLVFLQIYSRFFLNGMN